MRVELIKCDRCSEVGPNVEAARIMFGSIVLDLCVKCVRDLAVWWSKAANVIPPWMTP